MWWALDVDYRDDRAIVGGVGISGFADADGVEATIAVMGEPAPYQPGSFYERELPVLLEFLRGVPVTGVIVDGYVWLGEGRPGLGAHLYHEIRVPVIGVAKTGFSGAEAVALPVLRGESAKPLWITAVGVEPAVAAERVRRMHGEFRLPSVLKRVDQLCRGH